MPRRQQNGHEHYSEQNRIHGTKIATNVNRRERGSSKDVFRYG
jgi:hypothetical protein